MTEPLNRQRVLSLLDDIVAGDIEAALERCTDDVDFLTHAPIDILPHMGPRRGKPEMREMWKTVLARYSRIRYEAPILIAEGDKVAAYLRAFFTKRSNARVVQFDMAAFYTLREGGSRRSARSSIRSTWCSRCSKPTSPRCWPRAGRTKSSRSFPVIPERRAAANPESWDSPMRHCASEVWSCGPSRNDGQFYFPRRIEPWRGCRDSILG